MTEYELNRYNELVSMINNGDFSFAINRIDCDIVLNSDLKDRVINYIVNTSFDLDISIFDLINENDLLLNSKLLQRYYECVINIGRFNQYEINEKSNNSKELLDYFLEKVKDSNYVIKSIAGDVLNEDWFIRYFIDNNRLDVFQFVDNIDKKYLPDIYTLIDAGKGFFVKRNRDDFIPNKELYDRLFIDNLKNGYVSSYINDYLNENDYLGGNYEIIEIFTDLIDKDKDIYFDNNIDSFYEAYNIVNYILEKKKYKYLELFDYLHDYRSIDIDKVNSLLEENPKYFKYFYFYPKELLNDSTVESIINYDVSFALSGFDIVWYNKFKDLILKKIVENKFNVINCSLASFLDIKDKDLLKALFDADINNLFIFYEYLNSYTYNMLYFNEDFYYAAKEKICLYYGLNIKHLEMFVNRFGYKYLYYIKNENMRNAINLDDENFKKYMDIFDIDKLNIEDSKNIFDSLVQYRFKNECFADINRFSKIKMSFSNKEDNKYYDDLKVLASVSVDKIKKIKIRGKDNIMVPLLDDNALEEYSKSSFDYLLKVYNEIRNGINVTYNTNILYYINRQHIKDSREEFRNKYNYLDELWLNHNYDPRDLRNARISYYFDRLDDRELNLVLDNIISKLDYNISNEINNYELIKRVLRFLKTSGREYNDKGVVSKINEVKDILEKYVMEHNSFLPSPSSLASNYKIRIYYDVPHINDNDIFDILSNINPLELRDTVFNDDEKTKMLYDLMKKYKFIYWANIFNTAVKNSNLDFNSYTVSSFISKFNEVYSYINYLKRDNIDVGVSELINYSNVLGSSSNRYSLLLGVDNARLIKLNPTPFNNSFYDNREDIAVRNLFNSYNRKDITIKPIDRIIRINDNNVIVNLGNFTNPIGLTYGERNNTCMRIGGQADSLLNFGIDNINGFHCRLIDSDTFEFVSGFSGFRNGNSVYFNMVRKSMCEKYSDGDIVDIIREIAKMIGNDNSTIDNVFISPKYGFGRKDKKKELDVNIKEGYNNFYFDLDHEAICLYTSSNNSEYVPINFDNSRSIKYPVLRDEVVITDDKFDILVRLNKYLLLKDMFNKKDYSSYMRTQLLKPSDVDNIILLVSGEDFICYLDNDLNIVYDYIERNDNRVKVEIEDAVRILNEKKGEISNERANWKSR
ncbi:MAG: hypothetical protein IJI49_02620 [Bacilli bacterium]|nr:hypothetical protein [Bacilli bacterium]